MDLAPPLHVGHLRASVPCPDGTGLKEQLIRGLWLTQDRGMDGYRMRGEPVVAEVSVTLQQTEMHRVFSQEKLSLDHGTLAVAGYTGSREGRRGW